MSIEPPLDSAVIDTASTSPPPLWPSVAALVLSGWVGGIVATILWVPLLGATRFGSVLAPRTLTGTWLAPTLAGALVASALLPWLLRSFSGFELSLGSAFVVTLGRNLAAFAAAAFLTVALRGVVMPTAATLFVLPEILSLVAGYQLLKHLAEPVPKLARDDVIASRWLEQQPDPAEAATGGWGSLVAAVRIEVAQTISILERTDHTAVPAAVAEALPRLEALADRVEDAAPPSTGVRAAQVDLVAGIRGLQGGLVDLAETAWRGDHRRELEHLRGLEEIHAALAQLDSA